MCATLQRQLHLCLWNHCLPLLCRNCHLGCSSCSMLPRCSCYRGSGEYILIIINRFKNPDETCAIDLETTEGDAWTMKVAPSWTTGKDDTMDVTDVANKIDGGEYTCTSLTDVSVRYEVNYFLHAIFTKLLGRWWQRWIQLIRT